MSLNSKKSWDPGKAINQAKVAQHEQDRAEQQRLAEVRRRERAEEQELADLRAQVGKKAATKMPWMYSARGPQEAPHNSARGKGTGVPTEIITAPGSVPCAEPKADAEPKSDAERTTKEAHKAEQTQVAANREPKREPAKVAPKSGSGVRHEPREPRAPIDEAKRARLAAADPFAQLAKPRKRSKKS